MQPTMKSAPFTRADDRQVYGAAYEGLFLRALAGKLDARTLERLKVEAGLDLGRPLKAIYSFDHWLKCIDVVVRALYPHLPAGQAWGLLGRELVKGYEQTLSGRAALMLSGIIGPRRALQQIVRTFRTGCNYIETQLEELGPTEYRLWINEVGPHPEFTQSTLLTGLEVSGARTPTVRVLVHDGAAATYLIRWT